MWSCGYCRWKVANRTTGSEAPLTAMSGHSSKVRSRHGRRDRRTPRLLRQYRRGGAGKGGPPTCEAVARFNMPIVVTHEPIRARDILEPSCSEHSSRRSHHRQRSNRRRVQARAAGQVAQAEVRRIANAHERGRAGGLEFAAVPQSCFRQSHLAKRATIPAPPQSVGSILRMFCGRLVRISQPRLRLTFRASMRLTVHERPPTVRGPNPA